jgi:hypothetical protein
MGFPHAQQVARLERRLGADEPEVVYVVTSLPPDQADPERVLELVRRYWGIENGGHGRLDNSAREDDCRVRHPSAATALAWLRRFWQGEYGAWQARQPRARDRTQPTFHARLERRVAQVIAFLTRARPGL